MTELKAKQRTRLTCADSVPHPNSRAAKAARRRKRPVALVEHDLTPEQWALLQDLWGGCANCGAIDRAVMPACGPCNASKSNDKATSWMRRKLDERRFPERFVEVRMALTKVSEP